MSRIYVSGFSPNYYTVQNIQDTFARYGPYNPNVPARKAGGVIVLTYAQPNSANDAIATIDGKVFGGFLFHVATDPPLPDPNLRTINPVRYQEELDLFQDHNKEVPTRTIPVEEAGRLLQNGSVARYFVNSNQSGVPVGLTKLTLVDTEGRERDVIAEYDPNINQIRSPSAPMPATRSTQYTRTAAQEAREAQRRAAHTAREAHEAQRRADQAARTAQPAQAAREAEVAQRRAAEAAQEAREAQRRAAQEARMETQATQATQETQRRAAQEAQRRAAQEAQSKKTQEWLDYVEQVKEDLALNTSPFDDIDPALLLEVLSWNSKETTPSQIMDIIRKAQIYTADELEFIGDAVLHIIFTMSVIMHPLGAGRLTELRSQLERNSNLFKYATSLKLCENKRINTMKSCADIFEALIGALYIHLFYAKSMHYNALEYIEKWLDNLGYEDMLTDLIAKMREEKSSKRINQ